MRTEMKHLKDTGYTYFGHMFRAFSVSFVLIIHGIFPWVWETKASELLCSDDGGETGSTGVKQRSGELWIDHLIGHKLYANDNFAPMALAA